MKHTPSILNKANQNYSPVGNAGTWSPQRQRYKHLCTRQEWQTVACDRTTAPSADRN